MASNPKNTWNTLRELIEESGIWEHIDELRVRLVKAVIGLIIAIIASFIFAEKFVQLLAMPAGGLSSLQAIEVTETISVFMRVSLISGLIISLPWVLYQLLAFILPGLNTNEKKWVYIAIPSITFLFIAGVGFTYFVMLPTAIPFLLQFMGVETVPQVSNYINFVTGLMFWVGVAFQTPIVMFVLAKLQLISAENLKSQWRIAIVVIAVLAAVITPTGDPINMGLLMLPLTALYGLSILLAWLARKNEEH